ncbi:hypothetical protein QBC37DRAFT_420861 [Rhypophila decipiens]|uniref:Uncharacterized protein n=1 Tax=Rhypophila decipiens TaxID=261697 RepID=A0AAN7B6I5_9PEZI|nr:hypothetical protein QBC37DRAFT_420861 [Rhypophila decipiens]
MSISFMMEIVGFWLSQCRDGDALVRFAFLFGKYYKSYMGIITTTSKTLPNGLMTHFIGGICFTHGLAGHFLWSFFPSVRLFRFYILGGWILQMGCWTRSLCERLSAFAPCGFPFFGRLVLSFFLLSMENLVSSPQTDGTWVRVVTPFSFSFLAYGWLSILHGCRASPRLFSLLFHFFGLSEAGNPP